MPHLEAQKKKKEEEKKKKRPTLSGKPEVFRQEKTGRPSGVVLPSGRTFLGLGPDDIQDVLGQQRQRTELPEGTAEIRGTERQDIVQQTQQEQSLLEPTGLETQFESEGGFQELESRGERVIERVAEIGLKPSEFIAKGISKLTGIELEFDSAAELAETNLGKVLGVTSAAVGAAVLTASAGPAAFAATNGVLGKLAISLGASKGAVLVGGLFILSSVTGLNSEIIVDKILDRNSAQEIQSAVNTLGEVSSEMEGLVASNGLTGSQGLARIQQMRNMTNIIEHKLQQAVILDPEVQQSGQYVDILNDLFDVRASFEGAEATILNSIPEFNPAKVATSLERLRNLQKEKRQELIEQGAIREVL